MNTFLIYLLESSVCLGVFYLFYIMVLHNQTSYQYNRFYLLIAAGISFVLPTLEIPLGFSAAEGYRYTGAKGYFLLDPLEAISNKGAAREVIQQLKLSEVLVALYILGAMIAAGIFLKNIYILVSIIRKNINQRKEKYWLVHTHGKLAASSFFNYLFWDNTQSMDFHEQQQILTHEESHIRYGHSYDICYMAILKIIFWFHPLVYLYEKALIETHEYMADADVIQRTHPREYARLLTRSLFNNMQLSLVNHFYKSKTLKRIEMMNLKNQKTPWYKLVLVVPILMTVFFTFSCQSDEEQLTKESVAQSYEEVQAEISRILSQQHTIEEKYFPDKTALREAIRAHKGNTLEALKGADISSSDLTTYEQLSQQIETSQQKLKDLPDAEGVYTVVEDFPEPANGFNSFYSRIGQSIQYPAKAREMGIEGKVFVQFVVDQYGEITQVKTLKGIGAGCDAEAERMLRESDPWIAGVTKGKPVPVRMVLPITFKLDDPNEEASAPENKNNELSLNTEKSMEEMVVVGHLAKK